MGNHHSKWVSESQLSFSVLLLRMFSDLVLRTFSNLLLRMFSTPPERIPEDTWDLPTTIAIICTMWVLDIYHCALCYASDRQYFITLTIWVFIPGTLHYNSTITHSPGDHYCSMFIVKKIWYWTAISNRTIPVVIEKTIKEETFSIIEMTLHWFFTVIELNQFIHSIPLYSGLWDCEKRERVILN